LVSGAVEGPVYLLRKPVTEEALFLEIAQALEPPMRAINRIPPTLPLARFIADSS
jgi:hypothetical protein